MTTVRSRRRIPVAGPWITQAEVNFVADAAANAWYEDAGSYNRRFEHAFAKYLGVRHAVSLPSCTSAIHLALAALGIGPGDEVVVPDLTWIACVAPIRYVGATAVFADVDRSSWCLSAESFEECITPRTRAVIPVDLYGGVPKMDTIKSIAARNGIAVVEDAAEAIGSEFLGCKAGSLGDIGVFSFHGSKTLTTGEGGMLVTDRDDLIARIQILRDHGRQPGDRMFLNTEVGYKYKMSAMQAALGLAQLERVDVLVDRKREIFGWYRRALDGVSGITLNAERPGTKNSYWMVTIIVDAGLGVDKTSLMAMLDEAGIDSRPIFHPLSSIPAFAGDPEAERARGRNRTAYALGPYGINLPSALNLTGDDVGYVCERLIDKLGCIVAAGR